MRIKNTPDGWQKLFADFSGEDCKIEVNADEVANDIVSLRYFMPLAFSLAEQGKISENNKLELSISIPNNWSREQRDSLKWRLMAYFPEWKKFPFVSLVVGKTKLPSKVWAASRIFPLCGVAKTAVSGYMENYQSLKSHLYEASTGMNLQNGQSGFTSMANSLIEYIKNPEKYEGTHECNFSSDVKKRLSGDVFGYVQSQLLSMDILTQIVWLYILRELIESKQLFLLLGEKAELQMSILEKSYLDAISYGEAIYQVVENACLHSDTQRAWFGFRMYRAGKNQPMGSLPKEVGTREVLYNRYKHCFEMKVDEQSVANPDNIFNENHRLFFEFYVLDHAASQTGMAGRYNRSLYQKTKNLIEQFYKEQGIELPEEYPKGNEEEVNWIKSIEWLNKKQGLDVHLPVRHMQELFELKTRQKNLDAHIEDVTIHYGLRLLRHIISVNGGYLMGCSPGNRSSTQFYYNGNSLHDLKSRSKPSYATEWSALLPVTYNFQDNNQLLGMSTDGADILGKRIPMPPQKLIYVDSASIYADVESANKTEAIKVLVNNLNDYFCIQDMDELRESIILLNVGEQAGERLEWLAKAVFAQIATVHFQNTSIPLRIAIFFSAPGMVHEFTRLFSIFYLKLSEQHDMDNTQVALCAKSSLYGDGDIYSISLILTGDKLLQARRNAQLFAYHQIGDTLQYLPLISYLTTPENSNEMLDPCEVFPFDIFLPQQLPHKSGIYKDYLNNSWKRNWFTERIQHILHTDIQANNMGCMVDKVHIRLSSKLHLSRFYEAELLFHDVGNIQRFAYMVAQSLLYGGQMLNKGEYVLLLGYDKYSSSMVLQVEHWLKSSERFKGVYTAIVYDEANGDVAIRKYFDSTRVLFEANIGIQAVSILPVGTTLSTVYKMHNTAKRKMKDILEPLSRYDSFSRNFCLILVNEDLSSPSGGQSHVTNRYWELVQKESQIISVKRERSTEKGIEVKYYIPVDAQWNAPDECALCKRSGAAIVPLIDVKHADTMPMAIFPLLDEHKGRFQNLVDDVEENGKRLDALFQHAYYSHIYDGNNHFQFYIEFRDIFVENKECIEKSLRSFYVDPSAFHVVISPLQVTNSAFAKAVVDCVFKGNARFLHYDISDAYREEVRAKFSYITQEYKKRKMSNSTARFCVHFVDSSIVTGNSINRARLLMQMLLAQSGINYDDVKLFDKVFVLVNRCSYDSCNYFVREPDINMYAYLHLAIPSYNTENDSCPACGVVEKYSLLAKRSTTEYLSGEFFRLTEKHQKRTCTEYFKWLEYSILNKPSYFSWLKQWLYINVPASPDSDNLLCFARSALASCYENSDAFGYSRQEDVTAARDVLYVVDHYFKHTTFVQENKEIWISDGKNGLKTHLRAKQERYLKSTAKTTLADIVEYAERQPCGDMCMATVKEKALRLVYRHMVAVRDFMRLSSMSKAYEKLDEFFVHPTNVQPNQCRKMVVALISQDIKNNMPSEDTLDELSLEEQKRFCFACAMEWIITYVKVLSREHLANYYIYRQAIAGILTDLLEILCAEKEEDARKKVNDLIESDENWDDIATPILKVFGDTELRGSNQLFAMYRYELYIILLHRMANLQISSGIDANGTVLLFSTYTELWKQYFSQRATKDGFEHIPYVEIPTPDEFLLRYLKALKTVVMPSNNATASLQLTSVPCELVKALHMLRNREYAPQLLICARYIYLENTGLLYTGFRLIQQLIPTKKWEELENRRPVDKFSDYIADLSAEVKKHLIDCYSNVDEEGKEEDILYQNMLGNFCRFWHRSTGHSPIWKGDSEAKHVTCMLQYFRQLDNLSSEKNVIGDMDDIPYQYEELCRTICGFTHSKMCYIAFCSEGNSPEIFTQSGYYQPLMHAGKILDSEKVAELVRRSRHVWDGLCLETEKTCDHQDRMLVSSVAYLQDCMKKPGAEQRELDADYLVMSFPRRYGDQEHEKFYIILQNLELQKNMEVDALNWELLRKARDVLFMRQKLQLAISRDYTKLINFRFDCSYVRPFRNASHTHPSILHISDLHIEADTTDLAAMAVKYLRGLRVSKGMEIDLLIITGDIVDGRRSSAPEMEENYHYVEILLNGIADALWKDDSNYLPHDWKRRIVITTGNHDYASMNQYQAILKRRAITSAAPVETEGGTISKFAYFIDFMIRYLDPPTDKLIRDDLNEVRYYRKLNLKVLVLNCSSSATARRTNKIGINEDVICRLINQDIWKHNEPVAVYDHNGQQRFQYPFHICAAHYSPHYKLSYFLNNYDTLPGWDWEDTAFNNCCINKLFQQFETALLAEYYCGSEEEPPQELKEKRKAFLDEIGFLDAALQNLRGGGRPKDAGVDSYYSHLEKIALLSGKGTQEIADQMQENDLYQRFKLYKKWLVHGGCRNNEQISQLVFEATECAKMSTYDQQRFREFMVKNLGFVEKADELQSTISQCEQDDSFNQVSSIYPYNIDGWPHTNLFLAGHVHAYTDDAKDWHILIADQFCKKNKNYICGYIIEGMEVILQEETKEENNETSSAQLKSQFRYARLSSFPAVDDKQDRFLRRNHHS